MRLRTHGDMCHSRPLACVVSGCTSFSPDGSVIALLQHFRQRHTGMHVIDEGKGYAFADLAGPSSVTRELIVNPAHNGKPR
jgi:hypothetical protein